MSDTRIGGPFEYHGSSVETTNSLQGRTFEGEDSVLAKKVLSRYPLAVSSFFMDLWDDGCDILTGPGGRTLGSGRDIHTALKDAVSKLVSTTKPSSRHSS